MNYYAVDKWSSGDSLLHYKYIKKIKIGPFTRYFYSMDDLKSYYNNLNDYKNRTTEKNIRTRQQEIDNLDSFVKDASSKKGLKGKLNPLFYSKKLIDNKRTLVKNATKNLDAYKQTNWKLKNNISSAKQTGKFFLENMFGHKTKKRATKSYLSSQKKNKRYYKENTINRNLSEDSVWYKGLTSYQSSKWRKNK